MTGPAVAFGGGGGGVLAPLPSGQWVPSSQAPISAQGNLGNNTLRVAPKLWPAGGLVSVLIDVPTAGQAGSVFRCGVYADAGGLPGPLLVEFGAIAADSTTPAALIGSWVIPFSGVWWFGGAVQGAASTQPTIQGVTATDGGVVVPLSLSTAPTAGTGPRAAVTMTAAGALPAQFVPASVAGIAPRLLLKAA